jgi:hypothetical protein
MQKDDFECLLFKRFIAIQGQSLHTEIINKLNSFNLILNHPRRKAKLPEGSQIKSEK